MTQRDDVADLQRVLADYDPLDQQLQDPLPLGERRLAQTRADPATECLEVGPDRSGRLLLVAEALLLVALGDQHLPTPADLLAASLQFGQVDHLGLIRIDQSLLLAGEPLELGFPAMHRVRAVLRASASRANSSNREASVAGSSRRART